MQVESFKSQVKSYPVSAKGNSLSLVLHPTVGFYEDLYGQLCMGDYVQL